jgi:hypothetical protein
MPGDVQRPVSQEAQACSIGRANWIEVVRLRGDNPKDNLPV